MMRKSLFRKKKLSAHKPLVIAHRGASGVLPENTLAAFKLALAMQAEGIELDVHLTADGKPVVIHDRRVNRTTDGAGRVTAFTSAQLHNLDAGSWFVRRLSLRPRRLKKVADTVSSYSEAIGITSTGALDFSTESPPLLEEVFALFTPANPKRIYVELKGEAAKKAALLEATIALIQSSRLERHVTLLSFDHAIIREAKTLAPEIRAAATFPAVRNALTTSRAIIKAVRQAQADEAALHFGLVSRRLVTSLHEAKIDVSVWTVNRKMMMRRMIQCGVDAIMTNFPADLMAVLQENETDG